MNFKTAIALIGLTTVSANFRTGGNICLTEATNIRDNNFSSLVGVWYTVREESPSFFNSDPKECQMTNYIY